MTAYLSPAEAAARLGVSPKALRLYEARGLVQPLRTGAGWRAYGPDQMARAEEIAGLRALGLSLAQVARVLAGEPQELEPALALHQSALERQAEALEATLARVSALRRTLAAGRAPAPGEVARLRRGAPVCALDLPWPWGGERFELFELPALTWLVGPLGSGKTRLARALAASLPEAGFLEMARPQPDLAADPSLAERVAAAQAWLAEEGASASDSLQALLAAALTETPGALVVDMVEEGLDEPTQEALAAWLRARGPQARPLVLMTRSNAMLDLTLVTAWEAILYCPANHSPPLRVRPNPGAPGYEALATCLASPEARARTEGMVAVRAA